MNYKVIFRNDLNYIVDENYRLLTIYRKTDNTFVYPTGKLVTVPTEIAKFKTLLKIGGN